MTSSLAPVPSLVLRACLPAHASAMRRISLGIELSSDSGPNDFVQESCSSPSSELLPDRLASRLSWRRSTSLKKSLLIVGLNRDELAACEDPGWDRRVQASLTVQTRSTPKFLQRI